MIKKFPCIISLWNTLLLSGYCHASQPQKNTEVNDHCDFSETLKRQAENGIPLNCSFSWPLDMRENEFVKKLEKNFTESNEKISMVRVEKGPYHEYYGYELWDNTKIFKKMLSESGNKLIKGFLQGLFVDHNIKKLYYKLINESDKTIGKKTFDAIKKLPSGSFVVLCADPQNQDYINIRNVDKKNAVIQVAGTPWVLEGNSYRKKNTLGGIVDLETAAVQYPFSSVIRKYFTRPRYLFDRTGLNPTFDAQKDSMPQLEMKTIEEKLTPQFLLKNPDYLKNLWQDVTVCVDYFVVQAYGKLKDKDPNSQEVVLPFDSTGNMVYWEDSIKSILVHCTAIDLRPWYREHKGKILSDKSTIGQVCTEILKGQYIGTLAAAAYSYGVEYQTHNPNWLTPNNIGRVTNDFIHKALNQKDLSTRRVVYLTLLGGGSFANTLSSIASAMDCDEFKKLINQYHLNVILLYNPKTNDQYGLHTFETNKKFLESMKKLADKINTETGAMVEKSIIIPKDYNNVEKYLRNFYPLQTAKKSKAVALEKEKIERERAQSEKIIETPYTRLASFKELINQPRNTDDALTTQYVNILPPKQTNTEIPQPSQEKILKAAPSKTSTFISQLYALLYRFFR